MTAIRIASPPENLIEKIPKKHVEFYFEYARVVAETLRRSSFQKFLDWMTREENISKNKVTDIRIMVFPLKKKKGKGLARKCTKRGQISIYPRRIKSLLQLLKKKKEEKLDLYVRTRAMSTLIHELLHLKYNGDEERVKELTKNYFDVFNLHQQNGQRNKKRGKPFKEQPSSPLRNSFSSFETTGLHTS